MLYLHVQAACEQEHQVIIGGNIMRGDNLVFEEVLIELLGCVRGQVIYLRGDHEANREEVDRQDREEDGFDSKSV